MTARVAAHHRVPVHHTPARPSGAGRVSTPQRPPASLGRPPQGLLSRHDNPAAGTLAPRHALPQGEPEPAYSRSESRRPLRYLNGEVELPGELPDASGNTAPVCMHLARLYADSPKKADFLANVADRQQIIQTFSGQLASLERAHKRQMRDTDACHRHVVAGDQFGAYLAAMARQLPEATERHSGVKPEGAYANILLTTANHGMAAELQHKKQTTCTTTAKGETVTTEQHYYSVSVYDPNVTNNHKRVTVSSLDELAKLDFAAFLFNPTDNARRYGSCTPAQLQLSAICPQLDLGMPPLAFRAAGEQADVPTLSRQMTAAVHGGQASAIESLSQDLAGRNADDRYAVLQALDPDRSPGLFVALQDGYADVVGALARGMQTPGLSDKQRCNLLAAKHPDDGVPGFHMALKNGDAGTVRAFGEAVNTSGLPLSDRLELLLAARRDGSAGVTTATFLGQTDALREFGEALRQLCAGVDDPLQRDEVKREVLDAITSSTSFSAVREHVLSQGRHDVVTALDDAMNRIAGA